MADRINHLKVTVREADDGTRIIKWILRHYRHIVQSKENCKRAFKRGEITVNGQVVPETKLLHTNDIVEVKFDKGLVEREKLKAVNINIRYQDEHIAIVWKAAGQSFGIFERALQFQCSEVEEDVKIRFLYTLQKAASGLLVVAKSEVAKQVLAEQYNRAELGLTVRVICHGRVPADLLSTLDQQRTNEAPAVEDDEDSDAEEAAGTVNAETTSTVQRKGDIVKSIHIIDTTRSNAADYLTTLDLDVCTPFTSTAIRSLFFHQTKYPIVGNSTYTKQLKASKDKGLCMSIIRVSLKHPVTHETMTWEVQEPEKFQLLRNREQKFWRRNLDQAIEELRKAGINTTATEYLDSIETSEKKKPLAYILGKKDFCGHTFKVTEACLIPRPSSETLVEAATKYLQTMPQLDEEAMIRVLDIGTGCGNLLLSILHRHPKTIGVGLDISQEALQVAQQNAQQLGVTDDRVQWVHQNMNSYSVPDNERLFDIIVCNPPYLDLTTIQQRREHKQMLDHEPSVALFANDEGYEWYTVLSEIAPRLIQPKGRLILECGKGMMERVKLIFQGWQVVEILHDRQGWDRCLVLEME